jgi:lysozyme
MNRTPDAALRIIKDSENLELTCYLCPAKVPTIGYGHTRGLKASDVGVMTITEPQADMLLRSDVGESEEAVQDAVAVSLTDGQFGALVSLAFNIGAGAFRNSTLLALLNDGDFLAAADQFTVWKKGGGRVLPGLVTRRARERQLFLDSTP